MCRLAFTLAGRTWRWWVSSQLHYLGRDEGLELVGCNLRGFEVDYLIFLAQSVAIGIEGFEFDLAHALVDCVGAVLVHASSSIIAPAVKEASLATWQASLT